MLGRNSNVYKTTSHKKVEEPMLLDKGDYEEIREQSKMLKVEDKNEILS